MNLVTTLEKWAHQCPNDVALCDVKNGIHRTMNFAELLQRVSGVARQLHKDGFVAGQTVLILHPISIEFYIILLGAFHAGLVVMLVDPSAARSFISRCCELRNVDAFIGIHKAHLLRLLVPELRRARSYHVSGFLPGSTLLTMRPDSHPIASCDVTHPALITFTSGSTGVPKAAVRTHGFLLAQHKALAKALQLRHGEVDLITLPVFCLANLASGLCSVIADMDFAHPAKADPKKLTRQCSKHQVTRCAASPAFFEALLRSPLPTFLGIYTGGAPVYPDLLKRLQKAAPQAAVISVYGSTEAEPIADYRNPPIDALQEASSLGNGLCAGDIVEEIQCKVIRDQWGTPLLPMRATDFSETQCQTRVTGEIVVTGEHVLSGYLNGAGDRETKFDVDGTIWHRTGDAGYWDDSGKLWLMGRCSEKMILSNGTLQYPFGIECILRHRWPNVRAAVMDYRGKKSLIVENYTALNLEEWNAFAMTQGLDQVLTLEHIPLDKRHNAKIDYAALRASLDKLTR